MAGIREAHAGDYVRFTRDIRMAGPLLRPREIVAKAGTTGRVTRRLGWFSPEVMVEVDTLPGIDIRVDSLNFDVIPAPAKPHRPVIYAR